MVGEKVMLRVRMSERDAHYAGGLVNGSRMLDFFGDIATELCIRCDGDEGLLAAYDSVEFLAPVCAGDFIEYCGWIESKGSSSRKMKFEAHRVIENARDPNIQVSAANVLQEKVLIGKASATLVVPKKRQRGAQDPKFA
jgi:3-aminobutyryl-CoA ammonia-lyase